MRRLNLLFLLVLACFCFAPCNVRANGADPVPSTAASGPKPPPLPVLPLAPADALPGPYFFALGVRAFNKNQYRFAAEMYRVAASWAYKPAEYNLGVMYFRGQGVATNRPLGAAWMVLAAERGSAWYTRARNLMVTDLSDTEFARTDALWKKLRSTYGDAVALTRAKARWNEVRTEMTGSHVGGIAGNLSVGDAGSLGRSVGGSTKHVATTAGELTGAQSQDGSDAYRALRQTRNPYDPRFDKPPVGHVTVGNPASVTPEQTPHPASSAAGTPQ